MSIVRRFKEILSEDVLLETTNPLQQLSFTLSIQIEVSICGIKSAFRLFDG
jgi:hypothetical protein